MVSSFSSSVNIIRDENKDLNYIPTPNSQLIYRQIIDSYTIGQRSFSIIGSYGTGKSAFLWALEKHLKKKATYFDTLNGQFNHIQSFKFIQIIGDYSSLTEAFTKSLDISGSKKNLVKLIFNKLDKITLESKINRQALFIIIDECGKFLEYAAKHAHEKELYFIQQLAEYVNDIDKNFALITTLHQSFNSYASKLEKNQRDEWNKVKGRLKEIPFNEPVEQLLFLAANRIEQKFSGSTREKDDSMKMLFKSIKNAKVYPLNDYLDINMAQKLYPLDILSAAIITKSLQQYGQNERSLFSFIESGDFLGLNDYKQARDRYYSLACVYDYLQYNYFSYIYSRHNPHYIQWSTIKSALNRTENIFDKNIDDIQRIVKTIGLLNIFTSPSAVIDKSFLNTYCLYSLGIHNAGSLIGELENHKLIRYNRYSNKYVLFEGTDLDIDLALHQVSNDIPPISNISTYIKEYFDFPYISAKSIYYETGTPRFFELLISDQPRILEPNGQVDGYINLIFNSNLHIEDIINISENCNEAILFGKFLNTSDIEQILIEIEKIKRVILLNEDDRVAVRELKILKDNLTQQLSSYLSENLFSNNKTSWIYKGKLIPIRSAKSFNKLLSYICQDIYSSTPIFKSELVNRSKLTGAISSARRNLIKVLIENWEKENLGFDEKHFPPEKTIFLSLLKNTGIHRIENDGFILSNPINEKSFADLWDECEKFVKTSKYGKRNLSELVNILSKKPFKLKDGFIQFWFPIFLFIKRNDFALYGKKGYIPQINSDVLDLINKKPSDYFIKAFDLSNVKIQIFNRYRNILNQIEASPSNKTFIETIKPFFIFYKELPEYTRNTNSLSPSAIALRQAVKEINDPESVFFEILPRTMGYSLQELSSDNSLIEEFTIKLLDSLHEINCAFDALIQRIDTYITNEIIRSDIDFKEYKIYFSNRYKTLNKSILKPLEKIFLTRLLTPSNNKKAWINSIVHSIMNKPLERFSDDDEIILKNKLKYLFRELDNFCELSMDTNDRDSEEIIKIEMTSLVNGLKKNLVRLPKTKTKQMEETLAQISKVLSKDSKLNIAILVKLLQNELEND